MKKHVKESMIHIIEGTVFIEDLEGFLRKLKIFGKKNNVAIQVLDADKLAGEKHIRFAVEKALNSFRNETNIANDLAKEILLYAAGTRQINKAIRLGIHAGQNNVALVVVGGEPDLSAFEEISRAEVLEYNISKKEAIMKVFSITQEEIDIAGEEKIPELVLERVALVNVFK
ncbi:MAG: hypothetical protein J5U19_15350 [Candidatus Methanoperedens sp.]|nr:hypothetical protein [Candidatus Methanoperedens sp.]